MKSRKNGEMSRPRLAERSSESKDLKEDRTYTEDGTLVLRDIHPLQTRDRLNPFQNLSETLTDEFLVTNEGFKRKGLSSPRLPLSCSTTFTSSSKSGFRFLLVFNCPNSSDILISSYSVRFWVILPCIVLFACYCFCNCRSIYFNRPI